MRLVDAEYDCGQFLCVRFMRMEKLKKKIVSKERFLKHNQVQLEYTAETMNSCQLDLLSIYAYILKRTLVKYYLIRYTSMQFDSDDCKCIFFNNMYPSFEIYNYNNHNIATNKNTLKVNIFKIAT